MGRAGRIGIVAQPYFVDYIPVVCSGARGNIANICASLLSVCAPLVYCVQILASGAAFQKAARSSQDTRRVHRCAGQMLSKSSMLQREGEKGISMRWSLHHLDG